MTGLDFVSRTEVHVPCILSAPVASGKNCAQRFPLLCDHRRCLGTGIDVRGSEHDVAKWPTNPAPPAAGRCRSTSRSAGRKGGQCRRCLSIRFSCRRIPADRPRRGVGALAVGPRASLPRRDQRLLVGRLELGYSFRRLAAIDGRAGPDGARMALKRALVRLAAEMGNDDVRNG